MPNLTYDLVLESDLWPAEYLLKKIVGRVAAILQDHANGHIDFVFSDDAMVQILNREWRDKDKPTNVLSFPDGDEGENGVIHLGDVIMAYETVAKEAEEQKITVEDHLTHLLIHGSLHLLGYDHENDADAETMESLETRLLAELGIKNPYQDGSVPLD